MLAITLRYQKEKVCLIKKTQRDKPRYEIIDEVLER